MQCRRPVEHSSLTHYLFHSNSMEALGVSNSIPYSDKALTDGDAGSRMIAVGNIAGYFA